MNRNNGTWWQSSISLSISKLNISIGINKLQIERINDASKKIYSDFSSIFCGKLFFKECQIFSVSLSLSLSLSLSNPVEEGFHLEKISNKLKFGTVTKNYVLNHHKKNPMFLTQETPKIHNG